MKRLLLPFALILCSAAYGQEAITHYFPAGQTNAGVLIESYCKPLGEDLGTLANNGWYTTGATHSKFGFDISITMNSVFLTDDRKTYTPPTLSGTDFLGTITPSGTTDAIPTIYGNESEYPNFMNTVTAAQNPGATFKGPDGIDPEKSYFIDAQPLPTIQAGIGLFANTDLRLRFTPETKINDITMGTMGGAIMHDIKQHIPGLKEVPFSMSLLVGYTQTDGKIDLSGTYTGSGQEGKMKATSTTVQLLASKSLAVITFYGGLGYNSSKTNFDINGTYNVDHAETLPGVDVPLTDPFTLSNPYKYEFKSDGFRFTLGMRLKLGPFFLNGDYTFYGPQKLLTLGTGLTFR